MTSTPYQSTLKTLGVGLFGLLTLSSCGSIENEPTTTAGAEAVDQLGGIYIATAATDADGAIRLGEPPTVSIETEFGTLNIDAGCNEHFGSFTLSDDGFASFTIAGQTNQVCDDLTENTDQRVIDAFAQVDSWAKQASGLQLLGGDVAITLDQ